LSESKKTLSMVLNALRASYKSIDIRAVLGKSNKEDVWYCIFLNVLLTNKDTNEIKKKQNERSICNIDGDRFKVVFDCREIDQIDFLLNEIKQGMIKVSGILVKPIGSGFETIHDNEIVRKEVRTAEDAHEYSYKLVYHTSMPDNPITTIRNLGITEDEMGLKLEEISYCLNIDSLNNANNIIIILPIYCKKLLLRPEDEGKYLARFQIHRSLTNNLKAKVKVFGEMNKFKDIYEPDLSKNITNDNAETEMVTISIPIIDRITIEPNDSIEIDIFHTTVHSILVTEHFWGNAVLPGKKYSFWLKNVIERIDPNLLVLESWLEGREKKEKRKDKDGKALDFEKAVAMLLSLCGLIVVHVGAEYEELTIQSRREIHRKTSASIDIVALSPGLQIKEIFLCQCTTDWNDQKVIDILNISNELRNMPEASETKIQPIVITQVETEKVLDSKAEAESKGVKVISMNDLRMLLVEINENKKPHESALSLLS
jgi:hypothetical protein